MYFIKVITFIFLFTSGNEARASLRCQSLFAADYWKGVQEPSRGDFEVFNLGSGEKGGTVRRLVSRKSTKSKLEKEYYEPESLFNDVKALEVLELLSQNDPMVKIVRQTKIIKDEKLIFPDVRGHALDKYPDAKVKERLIKEFLYWALKIHDRAKTKGFDVNNLSDNHIWMSYRVPDARLKDFYGLRVIDIILKIDNVIINSETGQMIIFDPY